MASDETASGCFDPSAKRLKVGGGGEAPNSASERGSTSDGEEALPPGMCVPIFVLFMFYIVDSMGGLSRTLFSIDGAPLLTRPKLGAWCGQLYWLQVLGSSLHVVAVVEGGNKVAAFNAERR
jgi:hypothetical protein